MKMQAAGGPGGGSPLVYVETRLKYYSEEAFGF
jgi:hypothetical protein